MKRMIPVLCVILLLAPLIVGAQQKAVVDFGRFGETGLETIIAQGQAATTTGPQIAVISAAFLGTPYSPATLIGGARIGERLVVRLDGVDCFTFIDYVEALRRSAARRDFIPQLIQVRYRDGAISYLSRNHFFTDWARDGNRRLRDMTREIGGEAVRFRDKTLNLKKDGNLFLTGYPTVVRRIHFIPAAAMDKGRLDRLRTGDYIGFYSPTEGLDVSHAGIFIRRDGQLILRHASSRPAIEKVVDHDFRDYLEKTEGIIVIRPLP